MSNRREVIHHSHPPRTTRHEIVFLSDRMHEKIGGDWTADNNVPVRSEEVSVRRSVAAEDPNERDKTIRAIRQELNALRSPTPSLTSG